MKYRSRRTGMHPDIPLGAMQLCFSFQAPAASIQKREDEGPPEAHSVTLAPANFSGLSRALTAASRDLDLGLQTYTRYTPEHCTKLERLFLQMQMQVQGHIDLIAQQPEYLLHDQDMLWQMRRLHRVLAEALVVVRGVYGLCVTKRYLAEPTGSFWQLVEYVRSLRRACQCLARILPISTATALQQASA